MKKISFFTVIVLCFLIPSCKKENNSKTIIITSENCTRGKTHLENNVDTSGNEYYNIKWELGDGIISVGVAADGGAAGLSYLFVDRISTDGSTAYIDNNSFLVTGVGAQLFYPTDIFKTYPHYCLEFELSHEHYFYNGSPIFEIHPTQYYDETRIVRNFPMVGFIDYWSYRNPYGDDGHVTFYNICGLLRIKIKDGNDNFTHVKKIKITSGHDISGCCSFDAEYPSQVGEIVNVEQLTIHSVDGYYLNYFNPEYYSEPNLYLHGNNFVELICSNANNGTGVPLASDGTDFYFYTIPTLLNDMIIEVTNMNDEVATKNLSGHEIQIMRSQLTGIKVDFTNVPFN